MKVNFNLNLNQPNNIKNNRKINFEGYQAKKDNGGNRVYEFNYTYDDSKYDCFLELYSVGQDNNKNYYVTNILEPVDFTDENSDNKEYGIKLESGKPTKVDLQADYNLSLDQPFAYHYKLYPKNNHNASPIYMTDAGNVINETGITNKGYDIYNIVPGNAPLVNKGGSMKLIIPDNYNVAWKYDKNNNIVMRDSDEIKDILKSSKNFANKIGGTLAGVEKDLDDGKLDIFSRIITLPLFTDDSLTAHGYWNKNCFQMANSVGNINNYTSLQKKLFAKGINLVSDGAYVNEGLEGVHFQHILKWGNKSPYFNWFNISGLKDSPLSLGVFGKKTEHVTHRLVNSPYKFVQNENGTIDIVSQKYDRHKPTYIQIYDNRLANAASYSNQELIDAYKKFDKNYLDINNHNDTVIPYSFRINPETYKKNVERLIKYNKTDGKNHPISLYSGLGTRFVSQFEYFGLDGKHESGFYTWDANPDIAKLNYVQSHTNTQELKNIINPDKRTENSQLLNHNNIEVQDYAVMSGQYWTKKTNQILSLNIAQHLRNIQNKTPEEIYNVIKKQSDGKVFPKDLDVNKQMIKNVLKGRYKLHGTDSVDSYENTILKGLMDVPLDSIEVGDDIVGILASPLISKRANEKNQIGVSRYELFKDPYKHYNADNPETYQLANKMYTKEMQSLANEILAAIENKLPKDQALHDQFGNATPYGKYVIPLLTSEIARFAIIKGVSPKAEFNYDKETGEISYDYNALKQTSIKEMGIIADSPEDEAELLINKLRSRMKHIPHEDKEKLTNALLRSIKGTDLNSFRLAEMIMDRTSAGLDWRIDATKDIADIESLKDSKTNFKYTWDEIIEFWKEFGEGVRKYHPEAYIAAEVTDLDSLYNYDKYVEKKDEYGNPISIKQKSDERFANKTEAMRKLLNETGFTTFANYDYFSSDITKIFGKLFDFDGNNSPEKGLNQETTILEKLVGNDNYINSGSLESLIYSYTFAGNHDKCRALDGFAMDMDLVYTDLTDPANKQYRDRAYRILNGVKYGEPIDDRAVANYDFDRVSTITIAKCESIASGMGKAKEQAGFDEKRKNYIYNKMIEALKNLSNGYHEGKLFEAEGFGTKDYNIALDIVLDEMDYLWKNDNSGYEDRVNQPPLTTAERKKLKDLTLERIIDPAMSKLLGQTKFLVALTGNPTLFAGDELGSTGYETTTKNIYLQNRNVIHNEWADPASSDYKPFVAKFKKHMLDAFELRTRPELEPLNNGAPFALKEQNAHYRHDVYKDDTNKTPENFIRTDEGNTKVSALLRQSPDGKMTVSIFNTAGLEHTFDRYYDAAELTMPCIDLNEARGGKVGLRCGLHPGLKFRNADKNDKTTYYVNGNNQITGPNNEPIKFKDSTLILYHDPSFTGRNTMYNNQQYTFASNPYSAVKKENKDIGEKLSLLCK